MNTNNQTTEHTHTGRSRDGGLTRVRTEWSITESNQRRRVIQPDDLNTMIWNTSHSLPIQLTNNAIVDIRLRPRCAIKDELSNYRPNSNLSVISKILEPGLIDHLTSSKLLNPQQSAYCKHHSTETALLYIHDHLINATGSQKVSCLCLLDLSAAFDTIDHNILITRLSSWPVAFDVGRSQTLLGSWVQFSAPTSQPDFGWVNASAWYITPKKDVFIVTWPL